MLRDTVYSNVMKVKRGVAIQNPVMCSSKEEGEGVDPFPGSVAIEMVDRLPTMPDIPISGGKP